MQTSPTRRPTGQTVEAAKHEEALLQMRTVTAITGLSTSSIYRLINAGEIPVIRIGARCTRVRAGDLMAWLRRQSNRGESIIAGALK